MVTVWLLFFMLTSFVRCYRRPPCSASKLSLQISSKHGKCGNIWETRTYSASSMTQSSDLYAHRPLTEFYKSIATLDVVGGSSELLVAPSPDRFSFTPAGGDAVIGSALLDSDPSLCINRHYDLEDDDISNEEIVYGMKKEVRNIQGILNEKRLNRFIGGRVALRRALRTIENIECAPDADTDACSMVREIGPILADSHGAPDLPAHVHGSISHKDNVCVGVAIIADADRVGCDIERCTNLAANMLGNRVLTSNERTTLGSIGTRGDKTKKETEGGRLSAWVACPDEDTMLRFSFKEAIFKAIHPYLARSVDFEEVEVYPRSDGDAEVVFRLKTNAESTFTCTAKWYRYHHEEDGVDYFVTYARSSDIRGVSDPNRSKM